MIGGRAPERLVKGMIHGGSVPFTTHATTLWPTRIAPRNVTGLRRENRRVRAEPILPKTCAATGLSAAWPP